MRTHDHDDDAAATATKKPSKRDSGATPIQRKILDLQGQVGNAAVAGSIGDVATPSTSTNVQRHRLDPENADE